MTEHLSDANSSRRTFLNLSAIAGFTLAVGPLSADTILTEPDGLTVGMVDVQVGDGAVPAYRAKPEGIVRVPVIVVIHEIFAVHEHIKDVCRRLAKLGYYAIAPDLFSRLGDATRIQDFKVLITEFAAKVPDAQAMSDIDATVLFAKLDGGDTDRLGITGFCWGGRIVWLYAEHQPKLKAGVAWYGRLVGEPTQLQPKSAVDLAGDLKAPVLGLYGGADTGIPQSSIDAMKTAAKAAVKKVEFVVYPDTPHAFFADYRSSYTSASAQDGWLRLQSWFKENLV